MGPACRPQSEGRHRLKIARSADTEAPGGRAICLKRNLLRGSRLSRPTGPKPMEPRKTRTHIIFLGKPSLDLHGGYVWN